MGDEARTQPATPTLFLARLGAAMIAAGYPIGTVRTTLVTCAESYGVEGEMLVLPNHIQLSGGDSLEMRSAEAEVRFDQTFPLATLVGAARRGEVSPADGLAELARIEAMGSRFGAWAFVVGYTLQSAAFALILQPNLVALGAATLFGFGVGVAGVLARRSEPLTQLLPVLAAFTVALCSFTLGRLLHLGEGSLRALAPALVMFLPGTAITLAVIELSTRDMVSGSARLIAGAMRLAQLAFGILIAAQVVGLTASELSVAVVDRFGPWAPWLGCAVYAVGLFLYHGPPTRFMGWMLLILFVSYAGQLAGNVTLGSYASGFGGGLALALCALFVARRPNTPSAATLLLPGFWLLVPGSLGFIGVTELIGNDSSDAVGVTIVSMISIALGIQAGLLVWSACRQLPAAFGRRAGYCRP
ncbi:MAG: threonine/serine exporter family protein [Mycobacterium kyogaense]|uniref:threonine/serine ThrE exporter family protein n=1 Tax=Mycobacterium kyogaense TaxID=2212479 RepID=UPI002FF4663A